MEQLTIKDIPQKDLENRRVLVRVDFNVPTEKKDNKIVITNDLRIRASLPTIRYLIGAKAKTALVSHLGRPKGFDSDLKMDPVGKKLSKLNDSVGPEIQTVINNLKPGEVCLLENIRFYQEEEKNDSDFARNLAKPFEIYVNDAFGTSHRAHSSTAGVCAFLSPCLGGLLLQREVDSRS